MRFENIVLEELAIDDDNAGNFIVPATDELIKLINRSRRRSGFTDLVGSEYENDVYYNFYLIFDTDKREVKLQAVCNHGEKDDYMEYGIELFPEEERMLLFKIIKELTKGAM